MGSQTLQHGDHTAVAPAGMALDDLLKRHVVACLKLAAPVIAACVIQLQQSL